MTVYVNENDYPFTTVAFIEARFGSQWSVGSGVLVGRNDVLTASHVIYDVHYGLADEVRVHLSYNPQYHHSSTWYRVELFEYFTTFDPDGDGLISAGDGRPGNSLGGAELDIALLSLGTAVGDIYGFMGIDFNYTSGAANVSGYPGVYGRYLTNDYGYVWRDSIDHYVDLTYLDINPGNSGGPVWYDYGAGPYVIGVVSTSGAAASVSGHSNWLYDAIFANDYLIGGGGGGVHGTSGNDSFWESSGANTYFGYGGVDTFYFSGYRSAYSVDLISYDNVTVTNLYGDVFRLSEIERADFLDGALVFDITSFNAPAAYRLYGGAFDRVPDEGGLYFWIDFLDRGGSLQHAANLFIGSPEFASLYGTGLSNAAFVDQLYLNVLDRPGENAGVAYWTNYLNSGGDRAGVLVDFTQLPEYVGLSQAYIEDGYWVV